MENVFAYAKQIITPDRRHSKTLILSTNVYQKLLETELSIAIFSIAAWSHTFVEIGHEMAILIQEGLLSVTRGVLYLMKTQSSLHPQTRALGLYTICQTKYQSMAFQVVHQPLFYLSNLFNYRLLKEHTHIHCLYFPPGLKK